MKKNKYEIDMCNGTIMDKLISFSLPLMVSGILQLMFNAVDIIVVGRFSGSQALAAVGSTTALINVFINLFMGISSGATVVISQCYGARDFGGVRKTVHTSVAIAIAGGLIAMVVTLIGADPALRAMGTPADVIPDATLYLRIYALGMVPSFLYNIGSGILRAVGDTKRPLYFLIIACLTNIVLDVLFVVGFGMGVLGVATATVISQVVSCVLVMLMLMRSTSVFSVHRSEIGFTDYSTRRVLRVGLPAALQSNMFTIANIIIQSCINSFGTDTVAAWTAYGKVDGLFWMIMGALGISVTTFVGQNFGAQKYRRVRRSVRIGLLMGFAIAGLCSAVLLTFAHTLLSWFTTSENVLNIGMRTVQLTIPFYFTYVSVEVLSGAVRGTGDSFWPMIISASGICLLRMLWVFLVVPMFPGFDTIVMIFPISWGVTSLIFAAYYLQGGWMRRRISIMGYAPEDRSNPTQG